MTGGRVYEFDRFRLDADDRILYCEGQRISLAPKAFDVLVALVERRGTPLKRQTLLSMVWGDTAVEEGTLSSHISLLRKTLGADVIETIPKIGYRFVGDVATHTPVAPSRVLLAVLPFENLSGNVRYDSFSDGLTEEMITQLGRLNPKRLGVIARTSSMTYKSTDKTIEEIGRELGVSHVLEGSVRRAANRVRITSQLIQVSDQTHVWAETYESELQDVLTLQSRAAREVANLIQIKLQVDVETRRVNPLAYDAYLKGRYVWNRRTDFWSAIRYFQEAIDVDANYAPAFVGIADCYLTMQDHGQMSVSEAAARARPLLATALAIDEGLAEAHISLAHTAFHEFDWRLADREFRRALELSPSNHMAHYYHSNFLLATGDIEGALAAAEEAARLDPIGAATHTNLTSVLWYAHQFERAIDCARRAIQLHYDYPRAYEDLGRALEQSGAIDEAKQAFEASLAIEKNSSVQASLAHACAIGGDHDQARAILRDLEEAAATRFVPAFNFALIHAGLGEDDAAFRWFEKAVEERSSAVPFMRHNPRLMRLQREPRFQELMRRIGLG